jgi:glycosyltransferase involved in cell wall biosynthesis
MNYPKISIVIPSYNQGHFLEETILSIVDQDYPDLEILVVDGGSKDNSVDIIKKYEQHISWWVSEKDKGQSDAINKGFARVTGEIVTWLCSDDLYTKGTLKQVAELFSNLPDDVGVVYGRAILFGDGFATREAHNYDTPGVERYITGQAFPQPSSFIKTKYLRQAGPCVREDLHLGMDYDLFARLGCVCSFHPVKDFFSRYRLHDASKTVSQHSRLIEDWTRTFSNLCRNFGWDDILEKLQAIPQLAPFTNYHYPFKPNVAIINNANKELALFYHLCYWLKSSYQYKKRDDARAILSILKRDYPADWLANERFVSKIARRLMIPDPFLDVLVSLKRKYKKMIS